MANRLVVGNWKLYIESPQEAKRLVSGLRRRTRLLSGVEVVLAPSYTLIPTVASALKGSSIKLGAQAVAPLNDENRAHTGSVSAQALKEVGVTHVLVGHSERRVHESDADVNAQLLAAIGAGLTAILCVGERERDASGSHFSFVEAQLSSALKDFPKKSVRKLIVAYEPVWAIGKSAEFAMKPSEVQEMVIFIRKILAESLERNDALKLSVLYGAAVEPQNAHVLMQEGKVAGLLVGHASANLEDFVEIVKACK